MRETLAPAINGLVSRSWKIIRLWDIGKPSEISLSGKFGGWIFSLISTLKQDTYLESLTRRQMPSQLPSTDELNAITTVEMVSRKSSFHIEKIPSSCWSWNAPNSCPDTKFKTASSKEITYSIERRDLWKPADAASWQRESLRALEIRTNR